MGGFWRRIIEETKFNKSRVPSLRVFVTGDKCEGSKVEKEKVIESCLDFLWFSIGVFFSFYCSGFRLLFVLSIILIESFFRDFKVQF